MRRKCIMLAILNCNYIISGDLSHIKYRRNFTLSRWSRCYFRVFPVINKTSRVQYGSILNRVFWIQLLLIIDSLLISHKFSAFIHRCQTAHFARFMRSKFVHQIVIGKCNYIFEYYSPLIFIFNFNLYIYLLTL